jgi:uncharacterized cupredoxin-like copper-binding protein
MRSLVSSPSPGARIRALGRGLNGRWIVCAALLALLSACAGSDAVSTLQPPGYLHDAAQVVAGADWTNPDTVTVRLENYAFVPDELTFLRDRATRLVLVNSTETDHSFEAKEFFKTVAVKQLSGPSGTLTAPWVEHIAVPAGQTKELWFVPARYGAYHFECGVVGHATLGMRGLINVQ